MARKNTTQGLLADRPNPIAATNTYYFTTDEGDQHYYYSDGVVWRLQEPDFTEIDPSTEASLSCGINPVGAIEPFKVTEEGYLQTSAVSGSLTDRCGTIASGGTAQLLSDTNVNRKYFLFQNISDTNMYLGIGFTPSASKGILVGANGGSFACGAFIPTQQIKVFCATTGKAFVALEA